MAPVAAATLLNCALALFQATIKDPRTAWDGAPKDEEMLRMINMYVNTMLRFCIYRKAFRTSTGYLGLGPDKLEAGDCVCVFYAWSKPYIYAKILARRRIN